MSIAGAPAVIDDCADERGDAAEATSFFLRSPPDRAARLAIALNGLVSEGVLSEASAALLREETISREPLDKSISTLGLASEDAVAEALCVIFGCGAFDPNSVADPAPATGLSSAFLRTRRVFPFESASGELFLALADPTDLTGLEGCAFALGAGVSPVIATGAEIEALLSQLSPEEERHDDFEDHDASGADVERLRDMASEEPAVRLCNRLLGEAARSRASDIHIEPEERQHRIRFRIDGVLIDRETIGARLGLAAISRLKILSNLDIAERRRPQDGRFTFPVAGRLIDLRIASAPSVHGESVVLRLLDRGDVEHELTSLGFSEEAAGLLYGLSERPNGIILLTGPTGSGKTTTLYALLRRLAGTDRKILTIEDPVEYALPGISQTQANADIGLDFAAALRSFLRHDPDIIMVGELRDLETARTAVQAALTGHLVLTTLHTNDAPSAITRLIDMGVEDYLVASTLLASVGQRLVRRVCESCGGARPRELAAPVCAMCSGSGFYGRIAIAEILEPNDALKACIRKGCSAGMLREVAIADGFRTMAEDGAAKIAAGLTTEGELRRAIAL